MAEPPEGRLPPTFPTNGEATAAIASVTAAVEPMIASAAILTNDPDVLLTKEMLLRPSAPKRMVWVELNSSTDWLPRASRT